MPQGHLVDTVRKAQEKVQRGKGTRTRLYMVAVALLADKDLYARAVGCFYQVFAQLENSLAKQKHNAGIKELSGMLEQIRRTEAFEKDLSDLVGITWRSNIPKNEAATRICDRIRTVTEEDPVVLLAYTIELYSLLLSLRWARMWLFVSHKYKWSSNVLKVKGVSLSKFNDACGGLKLPREAVDRIVDESVRARDAVNDVSMSLMLHVGWLTVFKGLRSPLLIYALALFFLTTAILIGLFATSASRAK